MARKAGELQSQSEAVLQRNILKFLHTCHPYCWAIKVMTANERGVPDILCCYKSRFVAFEVKAGKGRATSIQNAQISAINFSGGVARVVRSKDEVKSILMEIDNEISN